MAPIGMPDQARSMNLVQAYSLQSPSPSGATTRQLRFSSRACSGVSNRPGDIPALTRRLMLFRAGRAEAGAVAAPWPLQKDGLRRQKLIAPGGGCAAGSAEAADRKQ